MRLTSEEQRSAVRDTFRYLAVIALAIVCLPSAPAGQTPTPVPVDGFITMNGSPVGTQVTPSVMRTGTLGFVGGTWTVNDSAVAIKVGPSHFPMPFPIQVGGTVYPTTYSTQSMQYDTFYNFNNMQANFPNNTFKAVTVSGYITFGIPNLLGNGASLSDLVRIDLSVGALAVLQLFNGNAPGDKYAVNIETDVSGTTHSPFITVTPGGSYWYSFKADYGNGKAYLNIYDTPNFNLVGSVIASTKKGSDFGFIRIGNAEEAKSNDHTHFNYFEKTVIDWTNAAFPLVPTSTSNQSPAPPANLRIVG